MKNIHKINIFNTSLEEAIKISLFYKDEYGRLRKKTNDYSGLQAYLVNDPYVDDGVVRIKQIHQNMSDWQSI